MSPPPVSPPNGLTMPELTTAETDTLSVTVIVNAKAGRDKSTTISRKIESLVMNFCLCMIGIAWCVYTKTCLMYDVPVISSNELFTTPKYYYKYNRKAYQ